VGVLIDYGLLMIDYWGEIAAAYELERIADAIGDGLCDSTLKRAAR